MRHLTIGEVAKMVGVNIQTVRYYERQGLIPAPPRRESGYRQYPEEIVGYIRFIKRAQELGFSLREIAELLAMRLGPGTACADVKKLAKVKIEEIEGKMHALGRMKAVLARLVDMCEENRETGECPILWAFDNDGEILVEEKGEK